MSDRIGTAMRFGRAPRTCVFALLLTAFGGSVSVAWAQPAGEEREEKALTPELVELKQQLGHPMSRVRRLAALRLGEIKAKPLVSDLGRLLLDKAQDVRKAAAMALVGLESKQALRIFRDRYADEPDPRLRFDWIDGASEGGENSVPFLLVALDDKEHQIRERCLDEIGRLAPYKVYKVVAPLLADGKVSVRVRAVRAYLALLLKAKEAGEQAIVDAGLTSAIAMLGDKASDVRAHAVAGLVALKTRRIDEELVRLVQDEAPAVRKAALAGLLSADPESAVDVIRRSLGHRDHAVRLEMVYALEKMGAAGAKVLASALTGNDAVVVRKAVVEVLAGLDAPEVVPALLSGLKDRSPEVRRLSAEALGRKGKKSQGKSLVPLLRDEDATVRRAAVEAMEKLLGNEAVALCEPYLRERDFSVQSSYFDFLRRHPSPSSWLLLGRRLADPEAGRRDEVLDYLASRKKEAVPALLEALKAPDGLFRTKVVRVLGEIGDPAAGPALVALLSDLRGGDGATVVEALSKTGGEGAREAVEDFFLRQPYAGEEVDARVAEALRRVSSKPVILLRLYRKRWIGGAVLAFVLFVLAFVTFVRRRAAHEPVLDEVGAAKEDEVERSPEWHLEELDRNIARDPAGARTRGLHFKRGVLHFHLGRWEDAKTDLEEAHRYLGDDAPEGREAHLLFLLGKTYERLGDKRYAFRKYSQSLKCHDKRVLAETMGRIAGQDGQAEDAEASIRMILEGLPYDEGIDPSLWR